MIKNSGVQESDNGSGISAKETKMSTGRDNII